MQKRGQDNCPQCRSPVVLRANASASRLALPQRSQLALILCITSHRQSRYSDAVLFAIVVPQGGQGEASAEQKGDGQGGAGGNGALDCFALLTIADLETEVERAAHSFREIQLDLVVQIFEVQSSVFHAGEQAEDEKVAALSTEQILDGSELLQSEGRSQHLLEGIYRPSRTFM